MYQHMEVAANIQSIVITNAIGLVLLISLLVTSYLTRERRHLDDRMFTAMIFVCAGACICEPATWLADGQPGALARAVNLLGNTYCYVATNVYAYLWVLYVDLRLHKGTEHVRRWFPGLLVPTAMLTAANLLNVFGQYMFTIDAANVYSRQPLSYLNYVMTFVSLFYTIWLRHKFQKEHGTVRFFPIAMFLVPIFCGALIQALFFGISLAWTCVCIGLVSIHMSQQNELSYIDPLTNLYNRTYLDYALQGLSKGRGKNSGIMIDVDFFKAINDTYGHSVGDEALACTARILTDCSPASALVIRFAGDEFIVLLSTEDEREVVQVESAVRDAVDEFNRTAGKPYALSLSMGHTLFTPGADDADSFLRRMDGQMYADKRAKHASGTLPDRRDSTNRAAAQ